MRATRINHVSIVANDLEESARFYEELFGMERIPTAKFPQAVLWMRAGTNQVHLFTADETAALRAHMDVALRVAERVTMMHDGRVIVEGTPDEIRANELVHDLYLGRGYHNE